MIRMNFLEVEERKAGAGRLRIMMTTWSFVLHIIIGSFHFLHLLLVKLLHHVGFGKAGVCHRHGWLLASLCKNNNSDLFYKDKRKVWLWNIDLSWEVFIVLIWDWEASKNTRFSAFWELFFDLDSFGSLWILLAFFVCPSRNMRSTLTSLW